MEEEETTANLDSDIRNATSNLSLQPNYSCRKVQEALEHLAFIDLIELCNEAKVEYCRATRDLRSCGRCVQSVLNSCRHASLCEECSQRCDACPICRIPIPKTGNRLSLRLFYKCIEAGLISKRYDDRFQEKDGEKLLTADVERLYSFFDVALENNLLSLICHYITDVCMDESAVSSDPVVALLLDEVVVKDWCKRTFKIIVAELQSIYNINDEEIKDRSNVILKFTVRLSCISTVLEELESSFKNSLSAQLHDIHRIQESILKTKQHAETMIWYTRHQFLEGLSRHDSISSWRSDIVKRKSMAIKRAWPSLTTSTTDGAMLFIDDALSNLDSQHEYEADREDELQIVSLMKDGGLSFSRVRIEGMVGSYPFENLRSAIDILFLCGNSDLVVAKQAILIYYMFDRLWKIPDEKWRFCIDDFSATFNVARHSILESFTFYLLDDPSDEALQEACRLLPEISGPTTHPKVAQVLLERENPYTALMVLRWSGRDSGSELVSLSEAVTAVRVRVECGLLIEAFMYQRAVCTKTKNKKARHEMHDDDNDDDDDVDDDDDDDWLEILVTEICLLCIRRNLVDRIIGLPWDLDEEKHIHKCLLDCASENPLSNTGSFLVVFYLQRYRYFEACQVDQKLQIIEWDFVSMPSVDDNVATRISTTQRWRAGLVEKSIQLLSEIEQQKVKSGQITEITPSENNNNTSEKYRLLEAQLHSHVNSSLLFQMGDEALSPNSNISGLTNYATPPVSLVNTFNDTDNGINMFKSISKNFKFDDIITSSTPLKQNRGSSRIRKSKNESIDSPGSIGGLFKSSHRDGTLNASSKSIRASGLGRDFKEASGDFMDMSWSNKDERLPVQTNMNGGPRWRSDDETGDFFQEQSPVTLTGGNTPSRGVRRSARLARR
ncbi:E3 ubiquitin-protein ligase HOS1-like [Rutidosis leptorrhynchoides]|uniref:E3 ubiquitin-protein ligase HOS1-like n=1 Tax=Rutidosis leptorrhynchoides TaxID=125765 RepID=UPI003A9A2E1B